MSLKEMARNVLSKSGTTCGTPQGTGHDTSLPSVPGRGTTGTRINTGESGYCPSVPNTYSGTVGHFTESGTPNGTERETLTAEWGDHAHLVEWFLSVKDTLPRKRFTLWKGEYGSVTWATPAASYDSLTREIEKGPGGPYAEEVRSILEQIHTKFGGE